MSGTGTGNATGAGATATGRGEMRRGIGTTSETGNEIVVVGAAIGGDTGAGRGHDRGTESLGLRGGGRRGRAHRPGARGRRCLMCRPRRVRSCRRGSRPRGRECRRLRADWAAARRQWWQRQGQASGQAWLVGVGFILFKSRAYTPRQKSSFFGDDSQCGAISRP